MTTSTRPPEARAARSPTGARAFAISVDAAAAVRALTERTRPSLAYDVVRVVRRALALGATRVDVNCARDRFVVRWQGAPVSVEELALIRRVLSEAGGDPRAAEMPPRHGADDGDAERASALLALEEQHSLALLAILATSTRAEVRGGTRDACAAAERGRLVDTSSTPMSATPTVVVWRDTNPAVERRELAMWCAHTDAPLYVDGKRVDRPFRAPAARLARTIRGPHGRALVGLASDPARASVVIYSHGVYLGVTPRRRGAIPLVAHVSVRGFGPEDDSVLARRAAEEVIRAAEASLLRGVADAFHYMQPKERRWVREALLDTDGAQWREPLDALPLFDAVGAPFSVSLAELRRATVVPTTAYARGHLPGTLLVDVRARNFLVRALGDVLRPAVPSAGAWWARLVGAPRVRL